MNLVRKEAEKCDRLGGFLSLLSLAGGTGSGVGAFVTQCLRDEFPNAFILNQVVSPYKMGEVIVSPRIRFQPFLLEVFVLTRLCYGYTLNSLYPIQSSWE